MSGRGSGKKMMSKEDRNREAAEVFQEIADYSEMLKSKKLIGSENQQSAPVQSLPSVHSIISSSHGANPLSLQQEYPIYPQHASSYQAPSTSRGSAIASEPPPPQQGYPAYPQRTLSYQPPAGHYGSAYGPPIAYDTQPVRLAPYQPPSASRGPAPDYPTHRSPPSFYQSARPSDEDLSTTAAGLTLSVPAVTSGSGGQRRIVSQSIQSDTAAEEHKPGPVSFFKNPRSEDPDELVAPHENPYNNENFTWNDTNVLHVILFRKKKSMTRSLLSLTKSLINKMREFFDKDHDDTEITEQWEALKKHHANIAPKDRKWKKSDDDKLAEYRGDGKTPHEMGEELCRMTQHVVDRIALLRLPTAAEIHEQNLAKRKPHEQKKKEGSGKRGKRSKP